MQSAAADDSHSVARASVTADSCAVQLPLLRKRWKQVVFGVLFQYCHGLATQLAHRMHRPMAQPLHDLGFAVLPVRMLWLATTSGRI
jgi:hypothetical protein